MGQDGEDGQGRDRLTPFDFDAALSEDRRRERRLIAKEAAVLLVIALLVAARLLFAR